MATTYQDLELIVRYDGSKKAFELPNGTQSKLINSGLSKVVFITGSTVSNASAAEKRQHIWITDGSTSKYLDMTDIDDITKNLKHIAGFAVNGTVAAINDGQNGLDLKGVGGISATLKPTTSTDKNGVPYWTVEIDGTDIKTIAEDAKELAESVESALSDLVGNDTGKTIREISEDVAAATKSSIEGTDNDDADDLTIKGAKKYADAVKAELKGSLRDDDEDDMTLYGVKSFAQAKASAAEAAAKDYADDNFVSNESLLGDDGKVLTTKLPDYILGQLMFGGFLSSATGIGANSVGTIAPTTDFGSRFPNITTIKNNDTDKKAYKGIYFIVQPSVAGTSVTFAGETFHTGDWVLSTGASWSKVDNTDSVSSVATLVGNISAKDLAAKLAASDNENELALKSEVDAKYSKPTDGIPAKDLHQDVQTAVTAAGSALQAVVSDTTTYIDANPHTVNNTIPAAKVSAKTKDIEDLSKTTDGLATTADVRKFLAAMLKVKVVTVS